MWWAAAWLEPLGNLSKSRLTSSRVFIRMSRPMNTSFPVSYILGVRRPLSDSTDHTTPDNSQSRALQRSKFPSTFFNDRQPSHRSSLR